MVSSATIRFLPHRVTGATAYLALFTLAVLQLGIALHHHEHEATELASDCVACVQHEQFDDVVTVSQTEFVVEPEVAIVQTSGSDALIPRPLRPYFGRAPPLLS